MPSRQYHSRRTATGWSSWQLISCKTKGKGSSIAPRPLRRHSGRGAMLLPFPFALQNRHGFKTALGQIVPWALCPAREKEEGKSTLWQLLGGKGCGVVASASALKWSVPRSNRSPATRRRSGGKGASTRKGVSARASDETDNPGGRGGFKPVPILSKSKWTGVDLVPRTTDYVVRDDNRSGIRAP